MKTSQEVTQLMLKLIACEQMAIMVIKIFKDGSAILGNLLVEPIAKYPSSKAHRKIIKTASIRHKMNKIKSVQNRAKLK